MDFSKTQVRKLGDRLRKDQDVSPEDITSLEGYRISYKESISNIFNVVYQESKAIRHDSITTYRLKRIESIIRKLYRFPSMELDRMWDIAGCRCIMNSEDKLYKLRDALKKRFNIVKERDYYKNPAPTGYKSIHLYLTESKDEKWPIEIQLRTKNDHNWATLVEIIDQLYGRSFKEDDSDPKFDEFFLLMSSLKQLNSAERCQLIELTHELSIFDSLYSVFIQNYLNVRLHWLQLQKPKNHHFFVIELEGNQPSISSFESFSDAEASYFKRFNSNSGANIVLTYLPQSNFENLETAYSNYTLTTHTFIDDYFRLLADVCTYLLGKKKFKAFHLLIKHVQANLYSNLQNIRHENSVIDNISDKVKNKAKYWRRDFNKRIYRRQKQLSDLNNKIDQYRPKSGVESYLFSFYAWRINRREKKFQKQFQRKL